VIVVGELQECFRRKDVERVPLCLRPRALRGERQRRQAYKANNAFPKRHWIGPPELSAGSRPHILAEDFI
jgi:hypothetical protein